MTDKELIEMIAPYVIKYCVLYGYHYPSAIIAQALHESSLGKSPLVPYNNFFGMKKRNDGKWKGQVVRFDTWEDKNKNGQRDADETVKGVEWRAFPTVKDGIIGYFAFIDEAPKNCYASAKKAISPEDYLKKLALGGWATDGNYANKVITKLHTYDLGVYDIVYNTIQGKYGNGEMRKKEFAKRGINYRKIQDLVNEMYNN